MINLDTCTPLTKGLRRIIYQHPAHDDRLIKVMLTDLNLREPGKLHIRKRLFRKQAQAYGRYVSYIREMGETCRVVANMDGRNRLLPIARCFGLTYTNCGLALVVEKITKHDSELAPTLKHLVRSDLFGPKEQERLDAFFRECSNGHVILGDFHSENIVYTDREDGKFICVDGFGEKAAVPVHLWSKRINARKLQRLRRRLLTEIEGHRT